MVSKPQIRFKGKASRKLKTERFDRGKMPLPLGMINVGVASSHDH